MFEPYLEFSLVRFWQPYGCCWKLSQEESWPWPVWLSGWGISLQTEGSQVPFPI